MTRRSLVLALTSVSGAFLGSAFAQKTAASKQPDKFALANQEVKNLLLLMDTDKNGRVSKQEWMNFMEAEFNRLDSLGKGELDLKELIASRVSVGRTCVAATSK